MAEEKTSWPELVGKIAEEAKQTILSERPDLDVVVGHHRTPKMWSRDFRIERVRVRHDDDNKVTDIPHCGN